MVRVYGGSDVVTEVIGKDSYEEYACFDGPCIIEFEDGTEIAVSYPKRIDGVTIGVWNIAIKKKGVAEQKLEECFDEEADWYTDIFEIDSEIKNAKVV